MIHHAFSVRICWSDRMGEKVWSSGPLDNARTVIAFRRGNVGFVALNNDPGAPWSGSFATGLPAGTYCNIVHGLLASDGKSCLSNSVTVRPDGGATLDVPKRGDAKISAVAIYTGQTVDGSTPPAGTFSSNYPAMYLRGTMNAWGNKTPMTLVADHTWFAAVTLKSGTTYQYKYEFGGGTSWSTNWGLNSNSTASFTEGGASPGGANIYFAPSATGNYIFQIDDQALTSTIIKR